DRAPSANPNASTRREPAGGARPGSFFQPTSSVIDRFDCLSAQGDLRGVVAGLGVEMEHQAVRRARDREPQHTPGGPRRAHPALPPPPPPGAPLRPPWLAPPTAPAPPVTPKSWGDPPAGPAPPPWYSTWTPPSRPPAPSCTVAGGCASSIALSTVSRSPATLM